MRLDKFLVEMGIGSRSDWIPYAFSEVFPASSVEVTS